MSKQDFDQMLNQQVADFPREKLPDRDLWQGIEHALADAPSPSTIAEEVQVTPDSGSNLVYLKQWAKPVAMAATFAFVGMFTFFSVNQPAPQAIGQELVSVLSKQHEEQKSALLVKFDGQPALTQNWQEQLTELDDAASAIKAALKEDPDNVALLKMLQNIHQQQIDLIERVHAPKWRQI